MEKTVSRETPKKRAFTTKELTFTALMAVLLIVCSWINIPTPWNVSFTLQTFAVFFSLVLLGGKCGTFSVLTFLLLGFAVREAEFNQVGSANMASLWIFVMSGFCLYLALFVVWMIRRKR